MSTTSSNYMNMPIPNVGDEPGPQYALDINGCLNIIDQHNHTVSSGQQVPSAGLNINTDLTFQGNRALNLYVAQFNAQTSPIPATGLDLKCIYVAGVDLYYNDANGNQIQITASGGVAGSPGSIGGLVPPASVTYSSSTFTFQQGVNTSGNLDAGSITLRNDTASSFGVTISPHASLGANYSLTLPASLPAVQSYLTLDNSGNIVTVGPYSRPISSTVGVGGVAISSGTSTFTTHSTSLVGVTGSGVTITTAGNPVEIKLISDSSGNEAGFTYTQVGGTIMAISLNRDGSYIGAYQWNISTGDAVASIPSSAFSFIDTPSAGTHAYFVGIAVQNPSDTGQLIWSKLVAYEL